MIRDLDGKAYIREDFLLIESGVITNTDLGQLMEVSPFSFVARNFRFPGSDRLRLILSVDRNFAGTQTESNCVERQKSHDHHR